MKAEAECRRTQGMAGEWEVVEQPTSDKVNDEANTMPESSKREAEGPPDSEDTRSFKLRKKVLSSVIDDGDADLIPIKLKPKKTELSEPSEGVKKEEESSKPTGLTPIKWTSRGWGRPEDELNGIPNSATPKVEEVETKSTALPESVDLEVKEEPETSSLKLEPPTETVGETGVMIRKRKFGGNRGKR